MKDERLARRIALPTLVIVLVLSTSCRPPDPRQPPHPGVVTPIEEVAQGSEELAGTYQLTRLNTKSVPAAAAFVRGCHVYLTDGQMTLVADGRYQLELGTERVCGDRREEREAISVEGLYAVIGSSIRFGDKMLPSSNELAPEVVTGPEAVIAMLFPDGRFAANGTSRVDHITVTLDNLRSFVFARDVAAPPPVAPRGAETF